VKKEEESHEEEDEEEVEERKSERDATGVEDSPISSNKVFENDSYSALELKMVHKFLEIFSIMYEGSITDHVNIVLILKSIPSVMKEYMDERISMYKIK
jgi:hypothetical protein